jgi:hypothetical protein
MTASITTPVFPKRIFVAHENPGTEDEFYSVSVASAEQALTNLVGLSGERCRVATYELGEVQEGKVEAVFYAKVG